MAATNPAVAPARLWRRGTLLAAAAAATLILIPGLASPAHADAIRDKQWHLDLLKAVQLHKITKGDGTTVAVIDSGVNGNHPDLKGNVLRGSDFTGEGGAWDDVEGHGTEVASIIGAHGHGPANRDGVLGLAPQAKILPGRYKLNDDRGVDTDEAIDWAVNEGASVMNLSFSGSGGFSHIENALANDVVVVAAAGNTKNGGPGIEAPAAYPGVIAVSGVNRDGDFSNESAFGPEVVLAAPMIDIPAASSGDGGRYIVGNGTSYATAIVSGIAALIRAKYPDISANGVINRLIETADDKGPPGRDDKYGFGVINPLKALTADIPDIDYNPLIEGTGRSPSARESTAPPKADSDKTEDTSLVLPGLALTAAVLILAGLSIYFFILARRRRGPGPSHASTPPGASTSPAFQPWPPRTPGGTDPPPGR